MNSHLLWQMLKEKDLVVSDTSPLQGGEVHDQPWYIRLLLGFCGWLASWFILGFLALGFFDIFDNAMAAFLLGLIIHIAAFHYYKKSTKNDFFDQAILVFCFVGQLLVAVALFEGIGFHSRTAFMLLGCYQLALLFLIDNSIHRYLTAFFALSAIIHVFFSNTLYPITVALVSAIFIQIWLQRKHWGRWKTILHPLATSLALIMLFLAQTRNHPIWLMDIISPHRYDLTTWPYLNLSANILLAISAVYLSWQLTRESGIPWHKYSILALLIVLAVGVMAVYVPNMLPAVIVLLIGKGRGENWLQALGVLAILFFFCWYYYWLDITLLNKSIILLILGLLLTSAYYLIHNKSSVAVRTKVQWNRKHLATLLTVVFTLLSLNGFIYNKEHTIKNGERILLRLAPVDPRSLMQGDFMRIRYQLNNQLNQQQDGQAIIELDENNVASYVSLFEDQSLNQNQRLLNFKVRQNVPRIGSQAFFFQEGQAQLFDKAAYGELVLTDTGQVLLVALRDAKLQSIGENRLD